MTADTDDFSCDNYHNDFVMRVLYISDKFCIFVYTIKQNVMEKVYVIVIDDVVEFENNPHAPKLFREEKSAYAEMDRLRRKVDNFPNHWQIVVDEKDCFECYPIGEYSENHYCLTLYCVEIN